MQSGPRHVEKKKHRRQSMVVVFPCERWWEWRRRSLEAARGEGARGKLRGSGNDEGVCQVQEQRKGKGKGKKKWCRGSKVIKLQGTKAIEFKEERESMKQGK